MTLEELKELTKKTKDFKGLCGASVDFVNPEDNKPTLKLFLSVERAINFYEKCPKPKKLGVSVQVRDLYGNGRWLDINIQE
ncbi:hypothetical protein HS1_000885 [Candidatus Desulfofervidus auxilii]|uniref:Uncharacterized protein n=1 Tax=Desulfofervidus auxilii TaxID=1621989 RepID=A0A7U4THC6_DESA2|nr:hypothetical protein [Candidatus Desulfofervidus auxilii]AMM40689.1 hypothetical protein HS1_000885 [Candidatus Desulfofervidus auxilii]